MSSSGLLHDRPAARTGRAARLSAEDRRAQILAAAVPLLRERGVDVSTRELAEAAGVAEGTLFRVFPDKVALLVAAVSGALEEATDSAPRRQELLSIDRGLPLEERLTRVAELGSARIGSIMSLVMLMRGIVARYPHVAESAPDHATRHARERENRKVLIEAITDVIGPDAEALRIPVARVVDVLQTLVVASQLPWISPSPPLEPAEVAAVLVHGVLKKPCHPVT